MELLVVIAVVILLVALAFPVVNRVAKRSDLVRCTANFHQLGIALGGYAGDHNGESPWPIDERDRPPGDLGGWLARTLKTTDGSKWSGIGKLFPYVRDRRIYICPANKVRMERVYQAGNFTSEDDTPQTSYVTRGYNQSYHPKKPFFLKLATMGRRSIAACNFAYAASNPLNFPLSWHEGTYPVLFSDGSVQQIRLPISEAQRKNPPSINDSNTMQMRIWDYFDGATTTLTL